MSDDMSFDFAIVALDCIQIDAWAEGKNGNRFTFAQILYFEQPLEEQLRNRYKYIDEVVSERTAEEIRADINAMVVPISESEF